MATSWNTLEDHVRGIAELRWNAPCKPEHIDGVDFDGVVKVASDEIILIEITKERALEKVRNDINKIAPTKLRLATQGFVCRRVDVSERYMPPYGQKYSPKLVDAIIRLLLREGLIERLKGDDGWVYKPVRSHAERMNRLRSELTLSEDSLWKDVASLRE